MNLNDEVRCDYLVTSKMKQVWQVEMDLLQELYRVCDKYNLKVIADAGTLLGAVRHKGFIPWDDDIDVLMTRDDYNKLCEVADKEFSKEYFFQNTYTDDLVRQHAQLRKNGTSAILKCCDFKTKHHKGIFIDIFILDAIPDDKDELEEFKKEIYNKYKYLEKIPHALLQHNDFISIIKYLINLFIRYPFKRLIRSTYLLFHGGKKKAFEEFEKVCSRYNDNKELKVTYISYLATRNFERLPAFKLSEYSELVEYDFEDTKIRGPKNNDYILTEIYGDYHKFVIGSSDHGVVYFNPNQDYKKYNKLNSIEFKKLFNK